MKNIKNVQIYKENQELYNVILPLWLAYFKELQLAYVRELCESEEEQQIVAEIQGLNRRINIQGKRPDMHFEVFFQDDMPVGFANFAIDTGGIRGLIEASYGCVMEFYISPEFRRKGYGKSLYEHIEATLKNDGTQNIYLTSAIASIPFWIAMGFKESGKIDPDNDLPIYIKNI